MDLALLTNPVLLIVNALAVLRLTRLATRDAFPLGVLRGRVIDWAQDRWKPGDYASGKIGRDQVSDTDRRKVAAYDGTAPLAYLITCPWCASVYLGAAVTVLAATGTWWLWIATPLALSAVTGALASLID